MGISGVCCSYKKNLTPQCSRRFRMSANTRSSTRRIAASEAALPIVLGSGPVIAGPTPAETCGQPAWYVVQLMRVQRFLGWDYANEHPTDAESFLPTLAGARRGSDLVLLATERTGRDHQRHYQGPSNNLCSLQEAIYASTFQSNRAISSTNPDVFYNTGCTAGTGDDIIVLAPGELYAFDHFWDGDGHNIFGPTATPIIVSKITIQGNGATLQSFDRSHPNNSRLFAIGTVKDPNFPSTTGDLTLSHVYVKGFHINGGDGASGGGGGLGAGGAIYNEGSLTIEYSTFEIMEQSEAEAAPCRCWDKGPFQEEEEDYSDAGGLDVRKVLAVAVVRAAMAAMVLSLNVLRPAVEEAVAARLCQAWMVKPRV
jgi:hypothetical protein